MADLADYADTYADRKPARNPLDTLRQIEGLKNFTFLFSCSEPQSYQPDEVRYRAQYLLSHPVNSMNWDKLEGLKVHFLNLFSCDHDSSTSFLQLTDIEAKLADQTPGVIRRFLFSEGCVMAARDLTQQLRAQGWTVGHAAMSHYTGVWPAKELPDGTFENSTDHAEDATWTEFVSRECFEMSWRQYFGEEGGVWHDACVKCWAGITKKACVCADGGSFLDRDWVGPGVVIGNPAIVVDTKVSAETAGGVTWDKSRAEMDFEERVKDDNDAWWDVFEGK